jgi:hypothetical protein
MYDHLRRGWFAISLMVLGFEFLGFILMIFMLGERPLGLWLFKRKTRTPEEQPSQGQTLKEETPTEGGLSPLP